MRALVDRFLAALARLVLRGFFRDIEIVGRDRLPRDRPVLVVANHFNALVDAVLVVHAVGKMPRFIAKAALWRRVWARPFLWLAGLVPVQRAQDEGDLSRNRSAFATCHELLARGKTVALFPEGAVSSVPTLAPVRTGAARIALGASNEGAEGLAIVPVGLMYEDKVALRSRALVRIGDPIELDAELGQFVASDESADESNQRAVRRLTREIARRMRAVAPDYADTREAAVLGRAAEIALREHGRVPPPDVPLTSREGLAQRLAFAPESARRRLLDTLARYQLDLSLLGLRDAYLVSGYRAGRLARLLVSTALRLAIVAPFALVGAAINAIRYWGVHWAGRVVRNPMLKATSRMLAGLVLFPAMWLIVAWLAPWDAWWQRLGVVTAAPVLGLLAVWALERAVAAHRSWRGWITLTERTDALRQVRADRDEVVALVEETEALAEVPDAPRPQDDPVQEPEAGGR